MSTESDLAVIRDSGLFDAEYYLANNPDVEESGDDPLVHFCEEGWRQFRSPRPGFNVWWYWVQHLGPERDDLNPLVHYATIGRDAGLPTQPTPQPAPGCSIRPVTRRVGCACSRVTTATASSTTTSWPTCAS